ncbi:MAG: hypothetical protein L0Z62_23480 [Gemmataceae bacterium]|nr:hypothetical protein [Gemmataceae bacterium]
MVRARKFPPSIYHHVRSGTDRVRVYLAGGGSKTIDLGPHDSDQAKKEYTRILAELTAGGGVLVPRGWGQTSINVFCAAHLEWAQGYHERRELVHVKSALRPVLEIYGHVPISEFGPVALGVCREWFVAQDYARTSCNILVNTIRRDRCWDDRTGVTDRGGPAGRRERPRQDCSGRGATPSVAGQEQRS